jgi:serine/threonine protein kinase
MGTVAFGPYELLRRLGSGGMAETFLAVRRGPGEFEQHVCVKRILPALESDPDLVRMFMEEARLAAQLRHANITQVIDFGVVEGSHYLALELVDGIDLRRLLAGLRADGRTLDPDLAVFIASELAAALEFAHTPEGSRHAVIHRDISPSNILLSRAGEVYLTDFGIARALGGKRPTHSGVVRGKVPYMAAEYALTGTFDPRSDLFALGVVLFEMLAGQRPYEGATELDTLTRIREGRHPPLAALCPSAPPALVAITEQLLVPRPDDRFQTAGALLQALAYVSPPKAVARKLGELVRASSPPLRDGGELTKATRTEPLSGANASAAYPAVTPAAPDDATRTSEPHTSPPTASRPRTSWAATDPTQISQHDRPSPNDTPSPPSPAVVFTSSPHDATLAAAPPPGARRPPVVPFAVLVAGGLALFAAAGTVAYVLIELLRNASP